MGQLGRAERFALAKLIDAWPQSPSAGEGAAGTDYSATSGRFRNALPRLRLLQLISECRDAMTASYELGSAVGK